MKLNQFNKDSGPSFCFRRWLKFNYLIYFFYELPDKKNSFSIKFRALLYRLTNLQNGICDVIMMGFPFLINGTGKYLPDLTSRVALKLVQRFMR